MHTVISDRYQTLHRHFCSGLITAFTSDRSIERHSLMIIIHRICAKSIVCSKALYRLINMQLNVADSKALTIDNPETRTGNASEKHTC